jgi:hypothetical protein
VRPRFVAFMEERQVLHITSRLALEWVQQAKTVQPAERARRLGFLRGFARHRSATDPLTEVPSPALLPYRSTRARPYLYTEQEVCGLLDAALQLCRLGGHRRRCGLGSFIAFWVCSALRVCASPRRSI